MELPEKIESILVAYLQGRAYPTYFTSDLIHPGESDVDKTTQVIQAVCEKEAQEDPPYSGNFWYQVEIQLRTPLTIQTAADVASTDPAVATAQIAKHKAVAAVLSDAIVITDLPAQLNTVANAAVNADASPNVNLRAFACIGFTDRQPMRDQSNDYLMSGFSLRLYACSNAAAQ